MLSNGLLETPTSDAERHAQERMREVHDLNDQRASDRRGEDNKKEGCEALVRGSSRRGALLRSCPPASPPPLLRCAVHPTGLSHPRAVVNRGARPSASGRGCLKTLTLCTLREIRPLRSRQDRRSRLRKWFDYPREHDRRTISQSLGPKLPFNSSASKMQRGAAC